MKTKLLFVTLILSVVVVFIIYPQFKESDDISNVPHSLVPKFKRFTIPSKMNSRFSLLNEKDYNTLIGIDFKFNIANYVCDSYPSPFLLIMVHSSVGHFEKRRTIRETWGRSSSKTKLVFLLGTSDKTEMIEKLRKESELFSDLVVGSFRDTYKNLTYKHVMGFKYALHHCPHAVYVLKTDDDVFVNIPELVEFIKTTISPYGAEKLIMCNVWEKAIVARSHRSRYRFSFQEFPFKTFPTYCSGWFILYSPDVVYDLYNLAQKSEYFWVDDVFITGILAKKAGIPHFNSKDIVMSKRRMDAVVAGDCEESFLLGRPNIGNEVVRKLWTCAVLSDREINS